MIFGPPKKRLWGLAAGGPLSRWNGEPFGRLESRFSPAVCRKSLEEWWSVTNREGALAKREWLLSHGHRKEALGVVNRERDADSLQCEDPAGRLAFALGHRDEIIIPGLVAWDLGRLMCVARWAHTGGFITSGEAWEWIETAGATLQRSYDSWESLGRGWATGYQYWNDGAGMDEGFESALDWLLKDADSPWKKIAWDTRL